VSSRLLGAGAGAVLTGAFCTPLDVAKTRLQLWTSTSAAASSGSCMLRYGGSSCNVRPPGMSRALATVFRQEGLIGLYAGMVPTMLMTAPAKALYFFTYEAMRDSLKPSEGVGAAAFLAGSGARVCSVVFTAPLEIVRTRCQAGDARMGQRPGVVFRELFMARGIRGLWSGVVPTLLRDVPFSAFYWSAFENCKERINPSAIGSGPLAEVGRIFVAGTTAGGICGFLTTPGDVLKTRRQVGDQRSGLTIVMDILHRDGAQGLFAGAVPRTVRVSLACGIMISTYEMTRWALASARDDKVTVNISSLASLSSTLPCGPLLDHR